MTSKSSQQIEFEAATKFAVVGATDIEEKLGQLLLAACILQHRNVVPINPDRTTVQGKTCLKSLRDLPDPSHTAVFIAVPPAETLEALQEAKDAGVPSIWLFTDRVDQACRDYIHSSGIESRCVITGPSDEKTDTNPVPDTTGPCKRFVPAFLLTAVVSMVKNGLKRKSEDTAPLSPAKRGKTVHCHSVDQDNLKEKKFLEFQKFAVVGASDDLSKNGAKIFQCMKEKNRNVVPVNPNHEKIQGVDALNSISSLPDPKHTAISIVVQPEVTLKILGEAKELDIPMIWIQPGAQDDAVLKYIDANGLGDRCLFTKPHAHLHTPEGDVIMTEDPQPIDTNGPKAEDTTGPCRIGTPSLLDAMGKVSEQVVSTASNVVKATANSLLRPCLLARLSAH